MLIKVVTGVSRKVAAGDVCRLEADVNWLGDMKTLWVEYPSEFDAYVDTDNSDWILASLLIPAMKNNVK